MSASYNVGSLVTINVTFTVTSSRTPIDPTTVGLELALPDGTSVDLSSTVVRDGVGVYHADYVPQDPGFFEYQWTGSGTVQATVIGSFTVSQQSIVQPTFVPPTKPTPEGFVQFVRLVMQIPTSVLLPGDPVISMALGVALDIVNRALCVASATIYTLAVYNLAGSNVINYAQDVPDAPLVKGSTLPFFADLRDKWDINAFVSGVIQASNDETTGNSMVVQEAAKNFTLANLQNLKDPWGRVYLSLAQTYGPSIWGIT